MPLIRLIQALEFSSALYPKHFVGQALHMVRNSMKYAPWKDYKAVATDLKKIYQSVTEEEALLVLD